MKTKTLIPLIVLVLIFPRGMLSQTISYGYDASGNRISRTISMLKSTSRGQDENQKEFKDNIEGKDIFIYPNPVKDELIIRIPDMEEGAGASLAIYDQGGKLVYNNNTLAGMNTIDVSGLPHGIYFLNIVYGGTTSRWKIIKD